MWFGSQNGLHRFDGKSYQTFLHDPTDTTSIVDNYIEVLYEDHDGYIWVGTSSKGINRYDPRSNTFQRFPNFMLDTLTGEYHYIHDIVEDTAHNIWIASLGGLFRMDASRKYFCSYTYALQSLTKYEIDPTGSKAGSLASRSLWNIAQNFYCISNYST